MVQPVPVRAATKAMAHNGRAAQRRVPRQQAPARHKATVTETAASRPGTPCSSASRGASPPEQPESVAASPPSPLGRPVEPPLHPSLQAMVDAARAALLPEAAIKTQTALEPPQPDYEALAAERLATSMGPGVDYSAAKGKARALAAEAQAAVQSFKRGADSAVPPAPPGGLPSWHSVEAMEDLSVFAAACAYEVTLRAAQIQHDVSEGGAAALSSSGRAAGAKSGALSAAKALQRLSARQAASARRSGGAWAVAQDEAGEEAGLEQPPLRPAARAGRAGEEDARAPPARKRSRSAGARAQKATPAQRPPLRDGSNIRAAAMSARAQAAFDRAVERRRGRPADVAFGRRVSGVPTAEEGSARPRASGVSKSGSLAPGYGQSGRSPPQASGHHDTCPGEAAPGTAEVCGQQQSWPAVANMHVGDGPVHAHSHMRPHVPGHVDRMLDGGSWPIHATSHMRGPPPEGEAATNMGADSSHWQAWAGDAPRQIRQEHAEPGAVLRAGATPPQAGSSTTDVALVALLQGLTEVIRHGTTSPPQHLPQHAPPALSAPVPAAPVAAPDTALPHSTNHAAASAGDEADQAQESAPHAGGAPAQRQHRSDSPQTGREREARAGLRMPAHTQALSAVQHGLDPLQPFGSMVEAAAWAAPRPPEPRQEFLSIVDLHRPPGAAAAITSIIPHGARDDSERHKGAEDSRAAEFVALEKLLHSGHSVPGTEFPFPAGPGRPAAMGAPAMHGMMQDLCAAGVRRAIEAGALRSGSAASSSMATSPEQHRDGHHPAFEPPKTQHADIDGRAWSRRGAEDRTGPGGSGAAGNDEGPESAVADATAAGREMLSDIKMAAPDLRDSVAVDILHEALEARLQALAAGGQESGSHSSEGGDGHVSPTASRVEDGSAGSEGSGGSHASEHSDAEDAAEGAGQGPEGEAANTEVSGDGGSSGKGPAAGDKQAHGSESGDADADAVAANSVSEKEAGEHDGDPDSINRNLSGE